MSDTFTGKVLLAHPQLRDPNFRHCIIYLIHHSGEEGTLGIVLNRPSGRIVADLLPEEDLGPLASAPVFIGGPVATDRLGFAFFHFENGVIRGFRNLSAEAAANAVRLGGGRLVGVVGHSGWSAGQLEWELKSNSWLVHPAHECHFTFGGEEECERAWLDAMDAAGPAWAVLAREPDEIGLN